MPSAPFTVPTEGPSTTTDQIHVLIDALPESETGGSPIISYQIDTDSGTGEQEWTELKGYSSNDASLEFIETELQISVEYKLRFRARNIFGWGDYSEIGAIKTIMKPDLINTPTVTQSVTNVNIEWSVPNANGDPIQYYVVQIQSNDGQFVEHDLYCYRMETNTCSIPMQILIDSQDVFRLTLGTII